LLVVLSGPQFSRLAGSTNGFADGAGVAAKFSIPLGVALDIGGTLYIADGMGAAASFFSPSGIAVDGSGNVYVADQTNQRLRFVTPAGAVSTGRGPQRASNTPRGSRSTAETSGSPTRATTGSAR
jgi:hypothetical protein